jgi:glycosyltransferase involved in cell wall biosynthesis
MRRLEIALIGSKGLPAKFGGVERHVEEIGRRLVDRGHSVTVYARKPFSDIGTYLGMRIRIMPSVSTKNLDTATATLAATFHSLFESYDIVHYHAIGPSIFSWIPSLFGKTTISTIHAPDYRQSKWGPCARYLLRLGERTGVRATAAAISVSKLMARDLEQRYGRRIHYIPNGATLYDTPRFVEARELGLERGRYILTVGRFINERGFHTLVEAFKRLDTDCRLVIAGEARFEEEYAARIKREADERVVFPGYACGNLLNELYAHCCFYVLPSLVEGLPISLIEAMSFGRPVLISDIEENLEVAGDIAAVFRHGDAESLEESLSAMLAMSEDERGAMGSRGRSKVEREYTWDLVTDRLETLYLASLATGRRSRKIQDR